MQLQAVSSVFDNNAFDGHQQVVFVRDRASGLKAIIAIQDTSLGPALGGCRMWPYDSEADALRDCLLLSRGMTYKNALAGLDFGGGKAVIIGDCREKSPLLLRAFAPAVGRLGGRFITGEDVGISAPDIEIMRKQTEYVPGLRAGGVGAPSPYTAYGVFVGLRAALAHRFGSGNLKGLRVAIQGLGNVGARLCRHLHQAGAHLVVADINAEQVARMVASYGAETTATGRIHAAAADVFAPGALGGILNRHTIPQIAAPIIAGSANNQIAADGDAVRLMECGILYAPDYAINAGDAIAIAHEGVGFRKKALIGHIETIGVTLKQIFKLSHAQHIPPSSIADHLAQDRLKLARAA